MTYMRIAELIVVGVPLGCVVVWALRAAIPARAEGQSARLHDRRWFLDIFRQGFAMVRRCGWIVLIPTAVGLANHNLYFAYYYTLARSPSVAPAAVPLVSLQALVRLLQEVPGVLPFCLVNAARDVTAALLCGYSFPVVILGCVAAGVLLLLRLAGNHAGDPSRARWSHNVYLRVAAGILSLCMASTMVFAWVLLWRGAIRSRLLLPSSSVFVVPRLLVQAFVATVMLVLMRAAADGESLTPKEALAEAPTHFRPMALFCLVVLGLQRLALVPLQVRITLGVSGATPTWRFYMCRAGGDLCLLAVWFVPFVIVIRHSSLSDSFRQCARLWAHHWRNVLAFTGISVLLMLLPAIPVKCFSRVFPRAGDMTHIVGITVSLVSIVLSALVAASTMAFCKAVLCEDADAQPSPAVPAEAPTVSGEKSPPLI